MLLPGAAGGPRKLVLAALLLGGVGLKLLLELLGTGEGRCCIIIWGAAGGPLPPNRLLLFGGGGC